MTISFKVKLIEATPYRNSLVATWMIEDKYPFTFNPDGEYPFVVEVQHSRINDFDKNLLVFNAQAVFV